MCSVELVRKHAKKSFVFFLRKKESSLLVKKQSSSFAGVQKMCMLMLKYVSVANMHYGAFGK